MYGTQDRDPDSFSKYTVTSVQGKRSKIFSLIDIVEGKSRELIVTFPTTPRFTIVRQLLLLVFLNFTRLR